MKTYGIQPQPCDMPAQSIYVPGVCICGAAMERHVSEPYKNVQMAPYREAVWAWLLEVGGIPSYYGGMAERPDIVKHIKECGINYDESQDPELQKFRTFNGTFTDTELYEDRIVGLLVCNCDDLYSIAGWRDVEFVMLPNGEHVDGVKWGLLEPMTIGEMIFAVIKAGEKS